MNAVFEKHGRKSGWLRHVGTLALYRSGLLREFCGPINKLSNGRLVFVCKGNIARSAYAAAKARTLGIEAVASAGLRARSGSPADPAAIRAAATRGVTLDAHKASSIEELALGPDDMVFAFELWQARELKRSVSSRVRLLGRWASPARPHVEDPYGLSQAYYGECFGVIDQCLERLVLGRQGVNT